MPKRIIIIDITDKYRDVRRKARPLGYSVQRVRDLSDLQKKARSDDLHGVIWHISNSWLDGQEVTPNSYGQFVERLRREVGGALLLGVSDNAHDGQFFENNACLEKLDCVVHWSDLKNNLADILSGKWNKRVQPGVCRHLPALSVLCQGFLAAHARGNPRCGEDEAIRIALDNMGWPPDGMGRAEMPQMNAGIYTPEWWRRPFALERSLREQIDAESGARQDCLQVQRLADWIDGREGTLGRPELATMVAGAFNEICDCLV